MKKLIISLCAAVFFLLSCSEKNEDIEKFKTQFRVKHNIEKVADNSHDGIFNLYTVYTVKNLKLWNKLQNKKDWMVEYSSNIREMVILNSIPMPKSMTDNIANDILMYCKENGYENAINVVDPDKSSNVFCKKSNDPVTGLIIISINSFAEDVESIEARCINGIFSADDVAKIIEKHGTGYTNLQKM
jgi:hypothetical protein